VVTNVSEKPDAPTFMVEMTSTLKMGVTSFSKMLMTTYKTTGCHNPEDHNPIIVQVHDKRLM
jgi:hypothetical protein